jgi:hypothetical protein
MSDRQSSRVIRFSESLSEGIFSITPLANVEGYVSQINKIRACEVNVVCDSLNVPPRYLKQTLEDSGNDQRTGAE